MKNRMLIRIGFMSFLIQASICEAAAKIVVIGNLTNKNTSIEASEVSKIFLGKVRSMPDGSPVKPVDQLSGKKSRVEFLDKVLHKSEPALKSYWASIIFTGNGSPPTALEDDKAVKKFVSENTDAIGYIDSSFLDSSVKVIYSPPD